MKAPVRPRRNAAPDPLVSPSAFEGLRERMNEFPKSELFVEQGASRCRLGIAPCRAWPHRRAAAQSRHARRRPDYWPMRRYLKEFLSDRARHRGAEMEVVADPEPHHPDRASQPQGPRLRDDLEQGAERGAAQDDHAQPGRDSSPTATRRPSRASSSTGPCATPIRRRKAAFWRSRNRAATASCFVPLYPQYAAATTATACDQAFRALMRMRWQPAVSVAPSYHDDPAYIDALARSMRKHLADARFRAGENHRDIPRHAAKISRCRAIPIIASARRRRGCCAKNSPLRPSAG